MSHYCATPNRTVAGDVTTCPDCLAAQAVEFAEAFRQYQAALNDPAYWTPNGREKNQRQVGEVFDRLVQLTNTILGDGT